MEEVLVFLKLVNGALSSEKGDVMLVRLVRGGRDGGDGASDGDGGKVHVVSPMRLRVWRTDQVTEGGVNDHDATGGLSVRSFDVNSVWRPMGCFGGNHAVRTMGGNRENSL